MKEFYWNPTKSARLKMVRGVSFEEIVSCQRVDAFEHPKNPDETLLLYERKGYIWVVPCVIKGEKAFLKTLYPSRKYTKAYKKGRI